MVSASDILKLSPTDSAGQQQLIQQIVDSENFAPLKEALLTLAQDSSKQQLAVQFFYNMEKHFISVEENIMEETATQLLNIFTSKPNPAFNRAEYKIRQQLADININVKGDFEAGIKFLLEADQQSDRLFKNMEDSEQKELSFELISNIAYQYFQNERSEYCRDWVKRLSEVPQYISQWEASLSESSKAKYEQRLIVLKQQRTNYFYLKANEEDVKKNFLRAAKLYLAFVKELNPNDPEIQSNLIEALDSAVVCTVLGETGALRSNILAQLYQDKNIDKSNHRDLLYKTHQKKLITEKDKAKLVEQLKQHQKAEDNTYQLSQQFSIYEKAITEHNIMACTQLFETISLSSLASKLLIDENDTEMILQTMINKGNIKAKIDQTTNFITFLQDEQLPVDFNDRIINFCGRVNDYLEKIQREKQ